MAAALAQEGPALMLEGCASAPAVGLCAQSLEACLWPASHEATMPPCGQLHMLRKRKSSVSLQEVGGKLLRQCHSARLSGGPILGRTVSMDECSTRSSPTIGGGMASARLDWPRRVGSGREGTLGDSDDNGDSPGSLEGFLLAPGGDIAPMEEACKRRRVTPEQQPGAHLQQGGSRTFGHLCNAAAALAAAAANVPASRAGCTPEACEAVPLSCHEPLTCSPEAPRCAKSGSSAAARQSSSSELCDGTDSPDSCYGSAFLCDGEAAAVAPAAEQQQRQPRSSMAQPPPRCGGICGRAFARPSAPATRAAAAAVVRAVQQGGPGGASARAFSFQPQQQQQLRPACGSSLYRRPGACISLNGLHAGAGPAAGGSSRHPMATRAATSQLQRAVQPPAQAAASAQLPGSCGASVQPLPPLDLELHQAWQQQHLPAFTMLPQQHAEAAAEPAGNPTAALANLMAGRTLARLSPRELALLIANHDGNDAALTQALQCAMSALSDAQLGAVGCALQELNRALRGPVAKARQQQHVQQAPPASAAILGWQHASLASSTMASKAVSVLRLARPALPPAAELQLELCRQLHTQQQLPGSCEAAAATAGLVRAAGDASWLEVLRMWSRGTDMVQADTPAFALHLWQRVRPLVCAERVAKLGAAKPWEAVALACLWVAGKHEEARRALPAASRLAPLAGCNARTLCAVEIHVMGLVNWAPLAAWDDARHSKGIPVRVVA